MTELVPLVERRIAGHFGQPIDALYRHAHDHPGSDPHLERTLRWHQRLVQSEQIVARCDDDLLARLSDQGPMTPDDAAALAASASRLTDVLRAREAVAITTVSVMREPSTIQAAHSASAMNLDRRSPSPVQLLHDASRQGL